MKLISTKFFSLLFVLLLCSSGFSAYAESEAAPTEISEEQSTIEESEALLSNIHTLSQRSVELKEVAAEIPAFDRLLFITLIINIEKEIRTELDRLVNIQQQLDKNSADYQLLLQKIKPLTTAQEDTLKNEIGKVISEVFKTDVELTTDENESIIGGFIIRVGDQQIDASVSHKLDSIKREFLKKTV